MYFYIHLELFQSIIAATCTVAVHVCLSHTHPHLVYSKCSIVFPSGVCMSSSKSMLAPHVIQTLDLCLPHCPCKLAVIECHKLMTFVECKAASIKYGRSANSCLSEAFCVESDISGICGRSAKIPLLIIIMKVTHPYLQT